MVTIAHMRVAMQLYTKLCLVVSFGTGQFV